MNKITDEELQKIADWLKSDEGKKAMKESQNKADAASKIIDKMNDIDPKWLTEPYMGGTGICKCCNKKMEAHPAPDYHVCTNPYCDNYIKIVNVEEDRKKKDDDDSNFVVTQNDELNK